MYKLEYKCILIQPILGIEITIQGRIKDCQELLYPVDVHFKIIPNRYINIIPNQKEGIEIKILKIDSPMFFILLFLVLCRKKDKGIDTKNIISDQKNHVISLKKTTSNEGNGPQVKQDELPVISLGREKLKNTWSVSLDEDGVYHVTGEKIEKFARRTDMSNYASINRLRDILKKLGIRAELTNQGATQDSIIEIAGKTFTLVEQY